MRVELERDELIRIVNVFAAVSWVNQMSLPPTEFFGVSRTNELAVTFTPGVTVTRSFPAEMVATPLVLNVARPAHGLRPSECMSPHAVLAVHAAGDPRHPEGSGQLFDWLARKLGSDYRVLAPTMPEPDEPHYRPWRDRIEQELGTIQDSVILFGHSFGGSILVKYLAEGSVPVTVRGLFLASVPFWGPGGWEYAEYDLPDDFADHLPQAPTFLYHSRDDPEVPFAHLGLYSAQLPEATVRPIPGAEHSFTRGLSELVADIRATTQP